MKGYVQVYTGNGKGKTTAALGLALRALGAGRKVCFIQFMKATGYSEHNIMSELSDDLTWKTLGKPFFIAKEGQLSEQELEAYGDKCVVFEDGKPPAEYVKTIEEGFEEAKEAALSGEYDLVVMDEINCAIFFGLISAEKVLRLMAEKAENTELVLTGRYAPREITDAADLVTEMKEIKHYYHEGVEARRGIEN